MLVIELVFIMLYFRVSPTFSFNWFIVKVSSTLVPRSLKVNPRVNQYRRQETDGSKTRSKMGLNGTDFELIFSRRAISN